MTSQNWRHLGSDALLLTHVWPQRINGALPRVWPEDQKAARKLAAMGLCFTLQDGVLYFVDSKHDNRKRAVVPTHLRSWVLEETHAGKLGGHFSGPWTYNTLSTHWWWEGMHTDNSEYCKRCPQYAVVSGSGRRMKPPLEPIPVRCLFQIIGVDVMPS